MGSRGFGVAGGLDRGIVREVARAVEERGYATFWANDTPNGDGLATLAEAAAVTTRIQLGVGVIPLDRQQPERIVLRIQQLGLPEARLILGVGSGGTRAGGLDRVKAGVLGLRAATEAKVLVGALGPRMLAVGGEFGDGVLLNWLTPAFAKDSAEAVRRVAAAVDRPTPFIPGYVRVALGAGLARLREEAARYGGFPSYAAHFARMEVEPLATTVFGDVPEALQSGLGQFDAVLDETVVRAVTEKETAEAYLELVEAGAPR